MAKLNKKQTSPRVAKIASKVLKNKNAAKNTKSLAGTAEAQAHLHPKKKGKKP
jgi:hypothetical protein